MFVQAGVPSMTVAVDGAKRTLAIYQDVYASPAHDRGEVVDALKQSELAQYVAESYNANSLTSLVRETWKELLDTAAREKRIASRKRIFVPPSQQPLGAALKVSLVYKLSSTKKGVKGET
jgi:hypothetical protein